MQTVRKVIDWQQGEKGKQRYNKTTKANIPMKIEMISKAVICAPSPLMSLAQKFHIQRKAFISIS